MFYVYQLPIPRLTVKDAAFWPIVERAARLICTTPEFDELARAVGLRGHEDGVTDPAERARLRAELDGLVAHLYGLTEAEFAHILTTFPLVAQEVKDAALAQYRALAPNPDDAHVQALIAGGEGTWVEFKEAAVWNRARNSKHLTMRENIVQGVAAFMNSREGGTLIVGVDKHGNVVGLADDYAAADLQKQNRDGYELFLGNVLNGALGAANAGHYRVSFHPIDGKEVCRIRIEPAPMPVYASGDFYVRVGNGKRKLNAQQAHEYIARRWGTSAPS